LQGGLGDDTFVGGTGDDVIKLNTNEMGTGDSVSAGTGSDKFLVNSATTFGGEFDFDRISDVTLIETTGTGAATKDTTLTFSAITETTDQVITVDASSITTTNTDLIVVNNSARATTDFSVTGGSGDDSIVGGTGDDTIIGGVGKDSITSGTGSDVFHYSATGQVFAGASSDSSIDNASDTLVDFTPGTDKISFAKIGASTSSLSFGSTATTAKISYASGKVYAINLTGTTIDGTALGGGSAVNKKGLIVYNPTAAAIDLTGANDATLANTLEDGAANGLEVIFLQNQASIDYNAIASTDFIFA
jgi:Ca2+-binding RTX toxin-like protein